MGGKLTVAGLEKVDPNALVLDESLADIVATLADEYDDLPLEDLEALKTGLSTERLRHHIKQLAVTEAHDRKLHLAQAARMAENLTDPQKAALAQHLAVEAADADEKVGVPASTREGDV